MNRDVCACRPLQIPWDVGIAGCLQALFFDVRNPLRIEPNSIKGIRLEDLKRDKTYQRAAQ